MDQQDGKSYTTGLRIEGQHCGQCGTPVNIVQPMSHDRIEPLITTDCCGALPCYSYVTHQVWHAKADAERTVWACCRGVAGRHLGEPVWLILPPAVASPR